MSKILKNYIYNIAYNLVALVVPLLTAPYLARTLGADMLGIFAYINSATSIICTVSMLGTYTFGNRQVAYTRDDKQLMSQEFSNIMGLRILLGVAGSIAFFVFGLLSEYRVYFLVYYIYYLGFVLDCSWLFVGVEDMKVCTIKNTAAKVGSAVCIFLFVKTEKNLFLYTLILALATFIANVSVYTQIRKYVDICKAQWKSILPNLKTAFQLCLPTLVATIYLQVDKLMIRWITGNTYEITYYDQAEKVIMIPLAFITVLSSVMMPRIANEFHNGKNEQVKHLITKACSYSMMMACPLMFGMVGIAGNFIPWYLGKAYMPVAYAVMVLAPYIITNTLLGISGNQYFMATDQVSILLKSNLIGMVANVITNAILIPQMGYLGAAIATVLSQCLMTIFQYYHMNRQFPIISTVIKQGKYLVYGGIMLMAVMLCGKINLSPFMITAMQIVVGMVTYFLILIIARDKQIQEIFSRVRKR